MILSPGSKGWISKYHQLILSDDLFDLKNGNFLGWDKIMEHMQDFRDFASQNPDLEFLLTPIGTGIAGGKIDDLNTVVNSMNFPSNVTKVW